ncbi:hypothetical protein GGF32_005194 [Allomyces javanicus]|nr:hypothetical protein GGF32_005194 [Allomyces javanicus]
MTILFALRASAAHDGTRPYLVQVCEPVVIAPDESNQARSLMDTLQDSTQPMSGPAIALLRNLLGVTPTLAEVVQLSGGTATLAPAAMRWQQGLLARLRSQEHVSHARPALSFPAPHATATEPTPALTATENGSQQADLLSTIRARVPCPTFDRPAAPTVPPRPPAQKIPQMVRFTGTLTHSVVSNRLSRERLLERIVKSLVPLTPTHLFLDEDWHKMGFWVKMETTRARTVLAVMRHSGLVIGGARVEFEPADAADMLPPSRDPPFDRPVFVLVNVTFHRFDALVNAIRMQHIVGDIDVQYGQSIGKHRLPFAYLTLSPTSQERDVIGSLDGIDVAGRKLRIFRGSASAWLESLNPAEVFGKIMIEVLYINDGYLGVTRTIQCAVRSWYGAWDVRFADAG